MHPEVLLWPGCSAKWKWVIHLDNSSRPRNNHTQVLIYHLHFIKEKTKVQKKKEVGFRVHGVSQ